MAVSRLTNTPASRRPREFGSQVAMAAVVRPVAYRPAVRRMAPRLVMHRLVVRRPAMCRMAPRLVIHRLVAYRPAMCRMAPRPVNHRLVVRRPVVRCPAVRRRVAPVGAVPAAAIAGCRADRYVAARTVGAVARAAGQGAHPLCPVCPVFQDSAANRPRCLVARTSMAPAESVPVVRAASSAEVTAGSRAHAHEDRARRAGGQSGSRR